MVKEKLTAVSVDDNKVNLLLVESMSKGLEIDVKSFTNPLVALDFVENNPVDLIFVDYMMPEMHGIDFIKRVRENVPSIPIIMITAVADNALKLSAIEAGATDFLTKPIAPAEFRVRISNMIAVRKSQLALSNSVALLKTEVNKAVDVILDRERETLSVLARASEFKDPDTGYHILRVAKYSLVISKELGCSEDEQDTVFYASPLHDIGKIGIPDDILTKQGALTNEEYEIMKTHTNKGYSMLKDAKSRYLHAGGVIAVSHHERFDGKGYPFGLKGTDIPLFGRIVAVADVFDAITSKRPYKSAWPLDKSFKFIEEHARTQFDPDIAQAFLKKKDEIIKINKDFFD